MNYKIILMVCLLSLLGACATTPKNTENNMQQAEAVGNSILNDAAIEFAKPYLDGLYITDPEQLLAEIKLNLEAIDAEQNDITPYLVLRALAFSQLGQKEEAFDDMTKAIQKNPLPELYAFRAFVLWRGGKLRGAMRDVEYALFKQDPLYLATMVQGLVYYAEEDMEKACSLLDVACEGGQCYGLSYVQDKNFCN